MFSIFAAAVAVALAGAPGRRLDGTAAGAPATVTATAIGCKNLKIFEIQIFDGSEKFCPQLAENG